MPELSFETKSAILRGIQQANLSSWTGKLLWSISLCIFNPARHLSKMIARKTFAKLTFRHYRRIVSSFYHTDNVTTIGTSPDTSTPEFKVTSKALFTNREIISRSGNISRSGYTITSHVSKETCVSRSGDFVLSRSGYTHIFTIP